MPNETVYCRTHKCVVIHNKPKFGPQDLEHYISLEHLKIFQVIRLVIICWLTTDFGLFISLRTVMNPTRFRALYCMIICGVLPPPSSHM